MLLQPSVPDLIASQRRVEAMTAAEMESLADDLKQRQPVMLHAFLSFRMLYPNPAVAGRLMIIGLVLWDSFRQFGILKEQQITDELLDRVSGRNLAFLKYLDGEKDVEEFSRLVADDTDRDRQQPTLAYLHLEITHNRSGVFTMPLEGRSRAFLTIKGVVDSLDEILNGPRS